MNFASIAFFFLPLSKMEYCVWTRKKKTINMRKLVLKMMSFLAFQIVSWFFLFCNVTIIIKFCSMVHWHKQCEQRKWELTNKWKCCANVINSFSSLFHSTFFSTWEIFIKSISLRQKALGYPKCNLRSINEV